MAQLLFKQGNFRILSDNLGKLSPQETNQLIKTAGTTCYQSRETSKKTPEEFIQMLQKRGHVSALEHSWFAFLVEGTGPKKETIGWELSASNNLFSITRPAADKFIVSGNSRMFNEAYQRTQSPVIGSILAILNKENPVLFPAPKQGFKKCDWISLHQNPSLQSKEEILAHQATTIEFNNCSRGLTHELVRSRICSYSQESTRYVDYAKGEVDLAGFQIKFILPYNEQFDPSQKINFSVDGKKYSFTAQEFTNLIEGWYRALRQKNLRPEEARQWLPIGIKAQIVMTCNLKELQHIFFLRTTPFAHPEIRFVTVELLKEMQKRTPVFNDFEIKTKEDDGFQYAVYTGDNPLV